MNNVVAIIPARGGSKGIPKKNVMEFCGKPLIAWSILQSQKSNIINTICVSTENEEIASISYKYGARIINRPVELATDIATTESAILHAIDTLSAEGNVPDLIVYLQPTSPLRLPDDIDNALNLFVKKKADSLFSAAPLDDFCAWKQEDGKLESITYDYMNRGQRQGRKMHYLENGSIYIFKPSIIADNNNRLGGKIVVYQMPIWQSYELDEVKDIEICEYFMNNKLKRLYG